MRKGYRQIRRLELTTLIRDKRVRESHVANDAIKHRAEHRENARRVVTQNKPKRHTREGVEDQREPRAAPELHQSRPRCNKHQGVGGRRGQPRTPGCRGRAVCRSGGRVAPNRDRRRGSHVERVRSSRSNRQRSGDATCGRSVAQDRARGIGGDSQSTRPGSDVAMAAEALTRCCRYGWCTCRGERLPQHRGRTASCSAVMRRRPREPRGRNIPRKSEP